MFLYHLYVCIDGFAGELVSSMLYRACRFKSQYKDTDWHVCLAYVKLKIIFLSNRDMA